MYESLLFSPSVQDQLMRMALIGNVLLVGVLYLVWGLYGESVTRFYSRKRISFSDSGDLTPRTPAE